MINTGSIERYSKKCKFVEIDLNKNKYENRLIKFIETKNILSGKNEYEIYAQWTTEQYHPTMTMCQNDLVLLHRALGKLIQASE